MDIRNKLHNLKVATIDSIMRVPAVRTRKLKKLIARPLELCLETTSNCNADCIMCPRKMMRRKMEKMPREIFEKAINEAAAWGIPMLSLQFYGDPLMMADEDLEYYLSTASRCKRVTFSTNGQLLSERKAEIVLRNNVDLMQVDMDGANKETFEAIRVNCKYETVSNNIRKFIELRKKLGGRTRIWLGCVVMPENRDQLGEIISQWQGVVDGFAFGEVDNRGGSLIQLRNMKVPTKQSTAPCYLPWSQMVIASDGSVPLCCNDWDSSHPLGNVSENSLPEIWHNITLRKVREAMISGEGELPEVCRNCDYWDTRSPKWWKENESFIAE